MTPIQRLVTLRQKQLARSSLFLKSRQYWVHKVRHFPCERDFYVFRNHIFKTYFESFNVSQKDHANKTFSSDACDLFAWLRAFWEKLYGSYSVFAMISKLSRELEWLEIDLILVISKHIRISHNQSVLFSTLPSDHTYLSRPCSFERTISAKSGTLKILWWKIDVLLWKWVWLNLVIWVQNVMNLELPNPRLLDPNQGSTARFGRVGPNFLTGPDNLVLGPTGSWPWIPDASQRFSSSIVIFWISGFSILDLTYSMLAEFISSKVSQFLIASSNVALRWLKLYRVGIAWDGN